MHYPIRFKREDFLEVTALLSEARSEGYDFLVTPRYREFWRERDFWPVSGTLEDAQELGWANKDRFAEPIGPVAELFAGIASRGELPDIFDVDMGMPLGVGLATVLLECERIGLAGEDVYHQLGLLVREDLPLWPVQVVREVEGGSLLLELDVRLSASGNLSLAGYTVEGNWFGSNVHFADIVLNINDPDALFLLARQGLLDHNQSRLMMNLNNLEELKTEVGRLGFSEKVVEQMEAQMRSGALDFKLHEHKGADKGQIEFELHFRKSGKSDYYYFNKYDVGHNTGKGLKGDELYLITAAATGEKVTMRELVGGTSEAIAMFRKQEGDATLSVVKGGNVKQQDASAVVLAKMEKGEVNFVEPTFKQTFFTSIPKQTFWVEQGKGFTAAQAVNMVQGRTVYRDDLLSMKGNAYKAWVGLDNEKERDKHGNLSFKTFSDPGYGFDLKAELDKFAIKELADPVKMGKLEAQLRAGDRAKVTVEVGGKEVKVLVVPAVRWGKLNFYDEKGSPEKREQFLKEPSVSQMASQNRAASKEVGESQGMRM